MKKDGFLDLSGKALGAFSALSPTADVVHDLLGPFSETAAPAYTCPIDKNCLVDGESKQKLTGADLEYWRYEFVAFCADYVLKRHPEIPIGGFNQLRQALMDSGVKFHLSSNDNKIYRFYVEVSSDPIEHEKVRSALDKYSITYLRGEFDPELGGLVAVPVRGNGIHAGLDEWRRLK